MIVREALREAVGTLASGGIEEARLESELLLRHVLGCSKAELYIRLEDTLPYAQLEQLNQLLQRRLKHEPTAYITGHKEFFGIDFSVNRSTLIPRPETEILVEKALELASNTPFETIADVGTGCGSIAIALAVHLPQAEVYATDISAPALEIAALNCQRHSVANRVHLVQADLLGQVTKPIDLIVANLPYVSDPEIIHLSAEVRLFEPPLALAGGPDGLRQITRLLVQARDKLRRGGAILLEIGQNQNTAIVNLINRHFPGAAVKITPDLSGQDRVIFIGSEPQKVAIRSGNSI